MNRAPRRNRGMIGNNRQKKKKVRRPGFYTTVRSGRGISSASNGFGPETRVKMTYEDLITIAPGTPIAQRTFRGNSVFDPDYTGIGHQPRYYDTYATVYGKYRVYGSKIRVDVINGSPTSGLVCAVLPFSEVVTATSFSRIAEMPAAKVTDIVPIASRYPQRIIHAASTKRVAGLQGGEIHDEDWAAAVGNNPVQIWYWNLLFESIDTTTIVVSSIRVRIIYDVAFYDRIDPGLSTVKNPEKNHKKIPKDNPPMTCNFVKILTDEE